jgi:hypothetical protein
MSNTSETDTISATEQAMTATQEIRDDVVSRIEKMDWTHANTSVVCRS